ncbi:GNAT family N-acetyltransferase [uncultured Microbacterium sp.]|uniref:GNAT family N-acetyltransferase n=1 Tax=uncultured Microbacterium sp. TaxID=191216 RepID=UPI00258A9224|nr:GNAT family N-acetyltransferase [uncultured Microbacterium sp.]
MSERMPPLEVRPIETTDEVFAAAALLRRVWGGDQDAVPTNLMTALAHGGNYVFAAHEGDEMVAASIAFFSAPALSALHSHVTGVAPGLRGRGLGRQLKEHQRAWAAERGIARITWTYDPLVARNAHFNLTRLGARATEYLVDFYGPMNDGINRGDATDRVFVEWDVAGPPAPAPADDEVIATVPVPSDIEALRAAGDPDAAAWRLRVRDALVGHLAAGHRIGGFAADRGYLILR